MNNKERKLKNQRSYSPTRPASLPNYVRRNKRIGRPKKNKDDTEIEPNQVPKEGQYEGDEESGAQPRDEMAIEKEHERQRARKAMRPLALPNYVRRNHRAGKAPNNAKVDTPVDEMAVAKERERLRALDSMRPSTLPTYIRRKDRVANPQKETDANAPLNEDSTETITTISMPNIVNPQNDTNDETVPKKDTSIDKMGVAKERERLRALDSMRPSTLPAYIRRKDRVANPQKETDRNVVLSSDTLQKESDDQFLSKPTATAFQENIVPGAMRVRGVDWDGVENDDDVFTSSEIILQDSDKFRQLEKQKGSKQEEQLKLRLPAKKKPKKLTGKMLSSLIDSKARFENEISQEKKICCRKVAIIAFCFVVIVGVVLGVALSGSSGGESKSGSAEEDNPEVQKCQYADVEKITQMRKICLCDESIELLPENYITKYNDLKDALFANNVNSLFNYSISSCEVPNLALHWLAEDSLKRESEPNDTLVERYVLATCFLSFTNNDPNHKWKNRTGWMSSDSVCEWFGITCNDRQEVTSVDLRKNILVGEIPAEISLLESLGYVWLLQNKISGSIPTEIGLLTNLVGFDLSNNRFSGSLPTEIGYLTKIGLLYLYGNTIRGKLPTEIWNLSLLKYLEIQKNLMTGSIPSEIGRLKDLIKLKVGTRGGRNKKFVSSIPSEVGMLSNLQVLDIYENGISGSIPSTLGACTSLSDISLSWNKITGTLPSEIGLLSNLSKLGLAGNDISGSIPSALWSISSLVTIALGSNAITGTLPSEIGLLSNLELLLVPDNKFKESIPSTIGNMDDITELDFSDNSFTGSVPSELGNCQNLKHLDISYNTRLKGTVPWELGDLSNLEFFNFYDTGLTGTISKEICSLFDGNLKEIRGNPDSMITFSPVTCNCCPAKSYTP